MISINQIPQKVPGRLRLCTSSEETSDEDLLKEDKYLLHCKYFEQTKKKIFRINPVATLEGEETDDLDTWGGGRLV